MDVTQLGAKAGLAQGNGQLGLLMVNVFAPGQLGVSAVVKGEWVKEAEQGTGGTPGTTKALTAVQGPVLVVPYTASLALKYIVVPGQK